MGSDPSVEVRVPVAEVDLAAALAPLVRSGPRDPHARFTAGAFWRATRTPDGPASQRVRRDGEDAVVTCWGPGARWLAGRAARLVGAEDSLAGFAPRHPLVAELHRRHPGLRMGAGSSVLEALVPSILEQKVVGLEARIALGRLGRALGRPAPGPAGALGLLLPPSPGELSATPYERFHAFGVERRRAETVRLAASYAARLQECADLPLESARARLGALPGVGPWTVAEVCTVALGDADAVSVGDYHLPNQVAFALAGEARGSDERMLELLEPYRGHRGRVLRLLAAGRVMAPRRGPRMPLNATLGFGPMPQRVN